MKSWLAIVGLVVLILLLIILGPIVMIWSLNTLFPVLAIPYTLETWVAVIIVAGIFRSTIEYGKKG